MPPHTESSQAESSQARSAPDPRRWLALVFISLAQLMVVVDATIVNIALPSAQDDLGISDGNRQWVITAYALAFGGLLLFGGRVADLWGRRQAFIIGLVGFALASALGGAAQHEGLLYAARALQGAFGAVSAPAALSLVTVLFTEPKERAKAFGVFGAIAGGGAAVGLLLGGLLTDYLDWRWTFFVNIPFAAVAAAGAVAVIREPAEARNRSTLDVPGVVLGSLGLVALVYGFSRAEQEDWTEGVTIAMFVASAVLLVLFTLVEARTRSPLLPLRVVTERNRAGAFLSLGVSSIAMFGLFLFLTYYMQIVRGYSPIETGVAFLPTVAGMMIGSTQIGTRLVTRVPPRVLMVPGYLVAALGMLLVTQLELDTSFWGVVVPAQVLLGLGLGTAIMPSVSLATARITPTDSGVASAMVNVTQQVGGAVGTALLNTIAASATTSYFTAHVAEVTSERGLAQLELEAMVTGYTEAVWWGFGALLVSALLALVLVNSSTSHGRVVAAGGEGDKDAEDVAPVVVH